VRIWARKHDLFRERDLNACYCFLVVSVTWTVLLCASFLVWEWQNAVTYLYHTSSEHPVVWFSWPASHNNRPNSEHDVLFFILFGNHVFKRVSLGLSWSILSNFSSAKFCCGLYKFLVLQTYSGRKQTPSVPIYYSFLLFQSCNFCYVHNKNYEFNLKNKIVVIWDGGRTSLVLQTYHAEHQPKHTSVRCCHIYFWLPSSFM
jgi:hypothetical protein